MEGGAGVGNDVRQSQESSTFEVGLTYSEVYKLYSIASRSVKVVKEQGKRAPDGQHSIYKAPSSRTRRVQLLHNVDQGVAHYQGRALQTQQ